MPNKERLNTLLRYCLDNRNRLKNFDFSTYRKGCILNQTPKAFPEFCIYDTQGLPRLRNTDYVLEGIEFVYLDFMEFFELDPDQFRHLFMPNGQLCHRFGGLPLKETCTINEVLYNLHVFIMWMGRVVSPAQIEIRSRQI